MPLMVTIQPWVFVTTCWSSQYDFNLVHHPTPQKIFFSYSEKTHLQAGFEPRTLTTNPEHTHALDRSAMAPLVNAFIECYMELRMTPNEITDPVLLHLILFTWNCTWHLQISLCIRTWDIMMNTIFLKS